MPEYLAIPAWTSEPRTLAAWESALVALGHPCELTPAQSDGMLLVIPTLGIEAFAEIEAEFVTAIDFAIKPARSDEALAVLRTIAQTLGWELHASEAEEE